MAAGLAADQLTKFLVFSRLQEQESRPLIRGALSLTRRINTGTVFGLFQGSNAIFVGLTIVALTLVLAYYLKYRGEWPRLIAAAAALVTAGALGNLIDRVMLGAVRDFIDFHVWPVFNGADVFICAGAAALACEQILSWRQEIARGKQDAA